MSARAKLIFFCGKMAAGKSTLARDLARRENAVCWCRTSCWTLCSLVRSPTYRTSSGTPPDSRMLLHRTSALYWREALPSRSTFPARRKRSARGFGSCLRAPMPIMNCILSTHRMPCASVSCRIEAGISSWQRLDDRRRFRSDHRIFPASFRGGRVQRRPSRAR